MLRWLAGTGGVSGVACRYAVRMVAGRAEWTNEDGQPRTKDAVDSAIDTARWRW